MKERETRIIYHRDLGSLECYEAPISLSDFVWDFVGSIAGTHVNTFVLHMSYNLYASKLKVEEYASETGGPVGRQGDHATWAHQGELSANGWRKLENRKAFVDQGIDPVATLIEAAHKEGLDFFAGIRMNDIHHAQWDWHPKFWIEHPEFRIGDHPEYQYPRAGFRETAGEFGSQIDDRVPAALDYIHDQVRAYNLALIEEAAGAYDVEGVELDFTRHPFFFKPLEVDAGRPKMTEFLSIVRERLNKIGKERGRPVVLEVRVPPTLEACWRIGLDVRRWMGDNLVDIMTVASLWHPDFGMPVEEFLDVADGTDCKILASFEFAEMPVLENSTATAKVIRAAALAYWKAGVDGIHLFNMHLFPYYFRQEMPFLNEIGDPVLLEYSDKHYMATKSSNYDDIAWFSYPKEVPTSLKETPTGDGKKIHLKIGDDVKKADSIGITAGVRLRLRVMNLTSKDRLEFKFNGTRLSQQMCKSTFFPMGESGALRQYPFMADLYFGLPGPYHWLEFKLEKETLPRVGTNEVEVILRKRNFEVTNELILSDAEITVEYIK